MINKKKIALLTSLCLALSSCNLSNDKDVDLQGQNEKMSISQEKSQLDTIDNDNQADLEVIDDTFLDESQRGEDPDALQDETYLDESQREDLDGSNSESSITETEKKIKISDLKVGQKITIDSHINVYTNAKNALSNIDSVSKYGAGTYYIFKIQDGAINITRKQGQAGGWINPNDLNIIEISGESDNLSKSSNVSENSASLDKSLAMKQGSKYSWSWAYPGQASSLLSKNNGYGKLSSSENNLYLTFDNGYEYKNLTSDILDTLKDNGVKATFFVTSDFIKSNPVQVKRMLKEGHLVGNHSRSHKDHSSVSAKETYNDIKGWETDFEKYIGSRPSNKVYRPPEGKFSNRSLSIANAMGYDTVLWSYAYNDWDTENQPNLEKSLKKALDNNFAGSVVLLHAISQTNADMLDDYIKSSKNAGYSFKLLP